MPENIQLTAVTMPAFEALVPEQLYNEATISLGILNQGIPSGVICLYYSELHYSITWIYVEESQRRNGLGTALLSGVTKLLREIGQTYPVDITFTSMEEDLLAFFQNYEHFYVHSIGSIYDISAEKRRESELYRKILALNESTCKSFFDYDKRRKDEFIGAIREKEPLLSAYIEKEMDHFEPELTLAYGNEYIRAAIFVKITENKVDINACFTKDLSALTLLLCAAVKKLELDYEQYEMRIVCFQEKTELFVRKLFEESDLEFLLMAEWDLRLPGEYPAFNN